MIEGLHPASKLLAFAFGLIFPRQYVVCMSAKKAVEKALKMLGLSTKGGEDHPNYQSPGSQMMIKGLIPILTMSAFAFGLSFVMLWHSLHCPSILACRQAKHVFKTQFSTITIFYTYTKENEKNSSHLQIYTFIFPQLHIINKSLFAIICLTLNHIVYRNDYKSMNQLKLDLTFYTLIYPHFFLCPCYALIDIIVEYRSMLSTSYP